MNRERTDGRAVFNGLQALSVVSAIIAIVILAIVLNLLLKQVWPEARLASYLCIWWSLGVVVVNWKRQDIDWPAANKFDFVAGLRVVRVATLWPRYLSH
ncbi:hypothetical protein SDC9_209872 [bioreactor metagenome]|uniref:Uncharacterized protein n=2 Tax=root TaxID=1 RepID=A0A0E3BBY0_9BURK|nr:hypothetical protein [Comamonas thiooxydans]KGG86185.1 hypothetical protein P245_20930 [Comamonas thiooxydans]